jgi:hypothetical protein
MPREKTNWRQKKNSLLYAYEDNHQQIAGNGRRGTDDSEEPMLWIACTLLALLVAIYTLRPLFRDAEGNLDIDLLAETELDRLLDRKNVIYGNLRDLEFEYKMGRLSDEDFQQLEAGYKSEAAAILQLLDQLNVSENLDETIEKDIAARKTKISGGGSKRGRNPAHCPSCGTEITPGKKFCADCGHRL